MTNDDIKEELEFIQQTIIDLTDLTKDTKLSNFTKMLSERFEYLKDETNFTLSQYENHVNEKLH